MKLHFFSNVVPFDEPSPDVVQAPCGVYTENYTVYKEAVNCKRCIKWLKRPRVDSQLTAISARYFPSEYVSTKLLPKTKPPTN